MDHVKFVVLKETNMNWVLPGRKLELEVPKTTQNGTLIALITMVLPEIRFIHNMSMVVMQKESHDIHQLTFLSNVRDSNEKLANIVQVRELDSFVFEEDVLCMVHITAEGCDDEEECDES